MAALVAAKFLADRALSTEYEENPKTRSTTFVPACESRRRQSPDYEAEPALHPWSYAG
jgi:hypothetical protein